MEYGYTSENGLADGVESTLSRLDLNSTSDYSRLQCNIEPLLERYGSANNVYEKLGQVGVADVKIWVKNL